MSQTVETDEMYTEEGETGRTFSLSCFLSSVSVTHHLFIFFLKGGSKGVGSAVLDVDLKW